MGLLTDADKEDAHAHEIAQSLAELLPESPDRALRVLDYLREMIEMPEPVGSVLLPILRLIAQA